MRKRPCPLQSKLGAETSKESTRKYRYTVINERRKSQTAGGERPGRDVVYWNSRENEQGNLGVCDQLQVAVLIHRHDLAEDMARYAAAKSQILSTGLKDGVPVHMLASLVAGTVATTVYAPADVVKSRLQSSSSLSRKRSVRFERHG